MLSLALELEEVGPLLIERREQVLFIEARTAGATVT